MVTLQPYRVSDEQVAGVLLDVHKRRWLRPFIGRECTVQDAALELGERPGTVFYNVQRLEELGLLRLVRTQPRRGRALKFYRAVADQFFVPFKVTAAESLRHWLEGQARVFEELFNQNIAQVIEQQYGSEVGLAIERQEDGELKVFLSPDGINSLNLVAPTNPAAGGAWGTLYLDYASAKNLQRELLELYQRYSAIGGGQPYLMRYALTPLLR